MVRNPHNPSPSPISAGPISTGLPDRIQQQLQKIGLSERQASLQAGLSDSYLRNIREGKSSAPRIDTLEKIAHVLGTTPAWLIYGEELQSVPVAQNSASDEGDGFYESGLAEPANAQLSGAMVTIDRRLPVYGQAVGGIDGEFPMNGTMLFDVLCPPQLSEISDAYAVIISGDSMYPRYEDGEMAFIDPTRRVRRGDYVVAQIMHDKFSPPHAYVKKFISHDARELVLEQFNPMKELRFRHDHVVSVHFVALAGIAP